MRAESSATSAVAALSVAVAALGHTLAAGGPVPTESVAPLVALAGACWLLGDRLAGRTSLSVTVLAAVQVVVHLSLGGTPHHQATGATSAAATQRPAGHGHHYLHGTAPGPVAPPGSPTAQSGWADAVTMTAAHLAALLVAVVLIARAQGWVAGIRQLVGRLVPDLPAGLVPVPTVGRLLSGVPGREPAAQRWLPSNVSRRGPPASAAIPASS